MPEALSPSISVTYIGRRDSYRDRLYGTGLDFAKGQTRPLPGDVARKFLRHADQFERATVTPGKARQTKGDDTAALLAQAALVQKDDNAKLVDLQDLRDQVINMDKGALARFAKTNYRQEVDQCISVSGLREQVIGFIDMYGPV